MRPAGFIPYPRPTQPVVYLIARPYRHAKHYIGFTQNARTLPLRVERHRKGRGARLMAVVVEAGIDFEVVRT